jgi:hypothetical protein
MAFNPFHRFRKHQKAFFAVLTIICMITFVFQFGAGDPFTRIMGWFGYYGRKGDLVITLYGDRVYQRDLESLSRQRKLAQDFMTNPIIPGVLTSMSQAVQDLQKEQANATSPDRRTTDAPPPLPFDVANIPLDYLTRNNSFRQLPRDDHHRQALSNLRAIREAALVPSVQKNEKQLAALDVLATAIAFEAWATDPDRKAGDFYFGGSLRTDDLLDFLIWKHQADRLGITLTEADVIREVNRAGGGRPVLPPDEPFERNSVIRQYIKPPDRDRRGVPQATAKDLLEALREEFRVQLAKEALMGHGAGVRAFLNEAEPVRMTPTAATPDEFLAYFRDHRTTLKVAVLPLDVADFTGKVSGEPSEQDLENRYEAYKERVQRPDDRTPGYMEPRRIRVQYASAGPENPFYVAEAKKLAKSLSVYSDPATSAALRVAAGVNPYAAGGGAAWLPAAALPAIFDPLLQEYESYRNEEEGWARTDRSIGFDLRDRGPVKDKPTLYASLVGQFLGAGLTGTATPAAGASILPGLEALYQRTTLRAFGSAVLAGGSGSPLTALALPVPFTHAPLPRQAVQPLLVDKFEKDLARRLVGENLATFRERLDKLRNKPEEARKYVEKAVKEFGLQNFHTEAEPRSIYTIADDPAVKPLKEAYEEFRTKVKQLPFGTSDLPSFADFVFGRANAFYATFRQSPPGLYQVAEVLPFAGKDTWLFWYTEDKAERQRSFAEVRDEVRRSWYFDKARILARAEAERISAAINKMQAAPADALKFLREQKHGDGFELENVAMLVPSRKPEIFFGRQDTPEFQPYEVPADKIAYPPANFIEKLLALKAPGQSLVIADRPMGRYYVVVLLAKSVPTLREFYDLYAKAAPDDPIWNQMMQDQRRDFQLALLKQLRIEAAGKDKVDEQGNLKLPENVRVQVSSTESGE